MPEQMQKSTFKSLLITFGSEAVDEMVSKIHALLTEKRARVKGTEKEIFFKDEVRYVITRLLDANANCIYQTFSQLEQILIELLSTENPMGKQTALSLLQYRAAHALFQYKGNLIQAICVEDSENKKYSHMANFERHLKAEIAKELGMEGNIFRSGEGAMDGFARTVDVDKALDKFWAQYTPVRYLQNECRTYYTSTGTLMILRNELLNWATKHYGLDGDDALSRAISEDPENDAIIHGGHFNTEGIQFLLEAAGIFQADGG
jgi:hypothetical protein